MVDNAKFADDIETEKRRVVLTERIAERVGVDKEVAHQILTVELIQAKKQKRAMNMTTIWQAVIRLGKESNGVHRDR